MTNPFIVFFDTFTHDGQIKENIDCVSFKSGIQLTELRILPFGCVVASDISDEPIIGATNPASFDLLLYSNSRTNAVVLQDIAKYHFDEKNGISSIVLKESIHSNFLLFRGRYSILTVAVFGFPLLSPDTTIPPATDLSVPPPQLGLALTVASGDLTCAPPTFHVAANPPFSQTPLIQPTENKQPWTPEAQHGREPPCSSDSTVQRTTSSSSLHAGISSETADAINESSVDAIGFYEDGEIQDIDYEEISSNEELFSDADEVDSAEDGRQPVDLLNENDIRLERCLWRFNPWTMASNGETGSASDRLRIPDPSATLFQLHCWLLERAERVESTVTNFEKDDKIMDNDNPVKKQDASDNDKQSGLLPPPPDDWTACETSARYLCSITEKFAVNLDLPLNEDWVEAIEGLEPHLAPGLAFLYHTDKQSFQAVTESLVVWVYMGLDTATALHQPNSAYIVRHLLAGITLAGLVTGSLCPQIAWSLLYPDISSLPSQTIQLEGLQVQHQLLNLLESPMITSTLKLAICRTLDQTTRLTVGLDSFLGRHNAVLSHVGSAAGNITEKNVQAQKVEQIKSQPSSGDTTSEEVLRGEPVANETIEERTDYNAENAPQYPFTKIVLEEPSDLPATRSPYQRLVFLFTECKHSRLTAAYQRLLNKVHAYELLVEFHEFIGRIRTQDMSSDDVFAIVDSEHRLTYFLSQIDGLLRNASTIVANPRLTPPCAMLLEESKNSCHNAYPDLCSMVDAVKLLDDLYWLVDRFKSTYQNKPVDEESSEVSYDCAGTPDSGYDQDPSKPPFVTQRSDPVWTALCTLLSTLMSEWNMLTFLASRPESTAKLLTSLLRSSVRAGTNTIVTNVTPSDISVERLVLGLELAYKMEAIRHLDVIIDWTRKKGVTGTHLTAAQLLSSTDERGQLEPLLHGALFGLARLCISYHNAPRLEELDDETFEAVKFILSASGPTWAAQVVSMDDNFVPFLILLEAFAAHDGSSGVKGSNTSEQGQNPSDFTPDSVSNSFRSTLRQLLTSPLSAPCLLNSIVLTVLHHTEDVNYLLRYGPHLAQLVQGYIWEESMNESIAVGACTRLHSFARAASPYLSWLRDFPTRPAAQTLLSLCEANSLFSESFAWLVNQLKPLGTELEEAMNELLSLETADDLMCAATATVYSPSVNRRQTGNQGIVAGRSLPPALLLLLRLIRAKVCDLSADHTWLPERQMLLGKSLALIELYGADGLPKLSALIEKMADFFLLNCQAVISQASSVVDLIGVSAANSNVSLLLGMLDSAVHIICQLLTTILHVQRSEFQDLTPVRPLCQAYACAVFAVCAPGPKAAISKRIRKAVISGLLAYTNSEESPDLSIKEIERSLWVSVIREVIAFTISASMYYIPGLKILLDLLPMSLPITSLRPLDETGQRQIRSARDRWAVHLLALVPELTGLTELLGGTDPVPSNPLYVLLIRLVQRLADLGAPCALFLATSCLDTMYAVLEDLLDQKRGKSIGKESNGASDGEPLVKSGPVSGSSGDKCLMDIPTTAYPLRTAGVRLLLQSSSDSYSGSDAAATECSDQPKFRGFDELDDTTELTSTLAFFYLNLQIPACRYAILHLLRQSPVRSVKSSDDTLLKPDLQGSNRSRKDQLLFLVRHILLVYSDKPGHIRTQLMLLKCLDLLFHTELAFRAFDLDHLTTAEHCRIDNTQLLTKLSEGQPDMEFSEALVPILLEHIGHPDRDMTTLPSALYPLLFLSQHDQGFMIVRNALDSPSARTHGQHFFANMVQRVNDCFSAENPDCQITLAVCLRLLQSLLVGRSALPITFTPESNSHVTPGLRRLHISSARVRDWIGWSAGGDEGKPVRDLHALLEMLTDDEPSLEYLRSGMKNLLLLLSEEFDIPECEFPDEAACVLPKPRSIDQLYASRSYFASLSDGVGDSKLSYRDVVSTRRKVLQADISRPDITDLSDEVLYSPDISPSLVAYNFADLASNYCGGVNIKEELAKCGRQRGSGEAAIRHQKRRRGQSSIIETGRSSKKFVAPMRGRGFVLRGSHSAAKEGISTSSLLGGPGCGIGASGIRTDPFRSRPLNTSRPPSLHVDDFTKLIKTDAVVQDPPRPRSYRDNRGFRGRNQRTQSNRETPSGLSLAGALVPNLTFGLPVVNPLATASLLPSWPAPRALPLLFNMEPRTSSNRRDRSSR